MRLRGRGHIPADLVLDEARTDDEVELELELLELCESVRRCGSLDADSMWETSPLGHLRWTSDWHPHNPARVRHAQARLEQQRQQRLAQAQEARRLAKAQRREELRDAAEEERLRLRRAAELERECLARAVEAERERIRQAAEAERIRLALQRREALEVSMRIAREINRARQMRLSDDMMRQWDALVKRNGWSEGEAAMRWNDWLRGPPGIFG
jgi:hypothetical protein